MKTLVLIIGVLFINSCSIGPKIVITKNFISNQYWDDYNNAIHVQKMKIIKDSVLDISDSNFNKNTPNHWNITNKLEVDSTFYFGYSGLNENQNNVKLKGRVYFTKANGFLWYTDNGNKSIVGSLENNTWYKISDLKNIPFYVYVFIDNKGNSHIFKVDNSNY